MKHFIFSFVTIFVFLLLFWLSSVLTSCTATLRADKLWYNGNVARYPVEHVVVPDSL